PAARGPHACPARRSSDLRLVADDYTYRIADPATEEEVAAGERGELQLRGRNVVTSYLGDAGEGAKAFSDDGWFRTGDLAEAVDGDRKSTRLNSSHVSISY